MRTLFLFVLCFSLAGCGVARQQEMAKVRAEVQAEVDACNEKYPKVQKTAVVRAQCLGTATDIMRPYLTYPDLYDQEKANRNVLAEKWQTGKITQLEYEAQFTEMHSQIVAEEQRRNLATRSVGAQESAAAASWLASPSVVVVRR